MGCFFEMIGHTVEVCVFVNVWLSRVEFVLLEGDKTSVKHFILYTIEIRII